MGVDYEVFVIWSCWGWGWGWGLGEFGGEGLVVVVGGVVDVRVARRRGMSGVESFMVGFGGTGDGVVVRLFSLSFFWNWETGLCRGENGRDGFFGYESGVEMRAVCV